MLLTLNKIIHMTHTHTRTHTHTHTHAHTRTRTHTQGGPCKMLQANNSKNICFIKKLFIRKFHIFEEPFEAARKQKSIPIPFYLDSTGRNK